MLEQVEARRRIQHRKEEICRNSMNLHHAPPQRIPLVILQLVIRRDDVPGQVLGTSTQWVTHRLGFFKSRGKPKQPISDLPPTQNMKNINEKTEFEENTVPSPFEVSISVRWHAERERNMPKLQSFVVLLAYPCQERYLY
jgi:hypothetical protein